MLTFGHSEKDSGFQEGLYHKSGTLGKGGRQLCGWSRKVEFLAGRLSPC